MLSLSLSLSQVKKHIIDVIKSANLRQIFQFRQHSKSRQHGRAGNSYAFFAGATMLLIGAVIVMSAIMNFGLGGFSNSASALTYQDEVNMQFTFNPTVRITISGDLLINDLAPGSSSDSNTIDVTSGTNSMGGHILYATVGNNTDTNPSHDSTGLINTSGAATFDSITTNIPSLANFDASSNGKWGYSYCHTSTDCANTNSWISGDYDDSPAVGYNGLPIYSSPTGVKLNETNNIAGTASLKFKIGAKAASAQSSGTYTNVVNFIGITKVLITNYTISYNDASGAGSGLPPSQSDDITTDTDVVLSSTIPTRTGYTFSGWCSIDNTADPTACTGGTIYNAGDTYPVANVGGTVNIPLYAVWGHNTYNVTVNFAGSGVNSVTLANATYGNIVVNTSGNTASLKYGVIYNISGTYASGYEFSSWATGANGTLGSTSSANTTYSVTGASTLTLTGKSSRLYMQNMLASDCTATPKTVYDSRDDQAYKVAKLADGKCWMVENLNLAGGTALGADKTDVTSAYISSFTTSNNLTKNGNTIVLPGSSTSGFDTANYSYVYNSGNKTNCGASGQNIPCYSYYSWDAATLGSGRTISTINTDAQQSICPKGWKLPTSRTTSASNWQTTSDFYAMAHQYGLDSTTSTSEYDADFLNQAGPGTTPNFLLAGRYYSSGSFNDGGKVGGYWSSTSDSNTDNAFRLFFDFNIYVNSVYGDYRRFGLSVRCLLR